MLGIFSLIMVLMGISLIGLAGFWMFRQLRSSEERRVDQGQEPEPSPPTWLQRNRLYVFGCAVTLGVGLITGGGIGLVRSNQAAADQRVVDASDKLVAWATADALIKGDQQMAELCPQGWNSDCASALSGHEPPISPPDCTMSTGGFLMDDACRAAFLRVKRGQIQARQGEPGPLEQSLLGNQQYQEQIFREGDASRITLLITDPRLKREVILNHWTDPRVSYKILAHPALTGVDTAKIYGQIQASCRYDAMPYLLLNPNLDGTFRGAWLARSQRDPGLREQTILLGLQQPAVSADTVHFLVDQAVKDGQKGDLTLWNILLKAAANGDLPVDRVEQMKEAASANSSFPSPDVSWEAATATCEWETTNGRHSASAQAAVHDLMPILPPSAGHNAREPSSTELCNR